MHHKLELVLSFFTAIPMAVRDYAIANVSKTLTDTQCRYSEIHKEAFATVFALTKFHQFLYGRHVILVTDHKPVLALFGPSKETPLLAANCLARWALMLSQFDHLMEFRNNLNMGMQMCEAIFPWVVTMHKFDREEMGEVVDNVCAICMIISSQIIQDDPKLLVTETRKDAFLTQVMCCVKEGWPNQGSDELQDYEKLDDSLSTEHGYLFYGSRVVIPASLQDQVLDLLHFGHFGIQRIKQLARSAVYRLRNDQDIERIS